VALAFAGAVLIAVHARQLSVAAGVTPLSQAARQAVAALQAVFPGETIEVPATPGVTMHTHRNGALIIASGMQAEPPVHIDLCTQLRADGRLSPLRVGHRFSDVERWIGAARERGETLALRNVLLVRDGRHIPSVQLSGSASPAVPLRLTWSSPDVAARWLGDAGEGLLLQHGWLAWEGGALRIERRASAACPQAGELVVQLFDAAGRADGTEAGRALLTAFPVRDAPVTVRLPAGRYAIPAAAPRDLEDESLFRKLREHGLLRLTTDGAADLAPPDLLQWLSAPAASRAAALDAWSGVRDDASTRVLLKRLYQQADGAYVRQQIDNFNSERRLLAWRLRLPRAIAVAPRLLVATDGDDKAPATGLEPALNVAVSAEGRTLATSRAMPASAARLFEEMPDNWQPWMRASGASAVPAIFTISLPRPANGREVIDLLLAGRMQAGITGARAISADACTGRACATPADVQRLTLRPNPGTTQIVFHAAPLDISSAARPGDQQYRHLRVVAGQLQWQALAHRAAVSTPRGLAANTTAGVRLEDRNGTPIWADGATLPAAREAGLNTLLGVGPEHAASVSGMLARAATGRATLARMTLDLPLQAKAQAILDCQGLHHGRWDGKQCLGAAPPPPGRRAGLVLLDADSGDILVAAGSGTAPVSAENWAEARDFDRSNPARSPLRLAALQHDGGANNSPGSTFKIISALGLERAAQADPQLNALLGGLPLNLINALAGQRGFAFQTAAATYPIAPRQAHITNYREQNVERRAQDGRVGLPQALAYSLNTWFAWAGELSDRSLFGRGEGGVPDLQPLEAGALDKTRPILAAARQLGFEQPLRLDGGLLPQNFAWSAYDALQATPSHMDTIHTRHELRQMSIGLRMQATPLQMALASAAIGRGTTVMPRLLLALDERQAAAPAGQPLGVRLDRIRSGMKGVVDSGTAAGAFNGPAMALLRRGLYGKTGTAPVADDAATVWFTGWLEPNTLPGRPQRLAFAAFISHSQGSGGEHAAPIVAALLSAMAAQNTEQKGK
jgi:cell division protein FtsI/penicillin-binding protein 2